MNLSNSQTVGIILRVHVGRKLIVESAFTKNEFCADFNMLKILV
jgi:hypothetical protein